MISTCIPRGRHVYHLQTRVFETRFTKSETESQILEFEGGQSSLVIFHQSGLVMSCLVKFCLVSSGLTVERVSERAVRVREEWAWRGATVGGRRNVSVRGWKGCDGGGVTKEWEGEWQRVERYVREWEVLRHFIFWKNPIRNWVSVSKWHPEISYFHVDGHVT